MTIPTVQASPPAFTSQNAAPAQSSGVISADFQTFLQMLTTQMMNQDPLNPIDSSDYAAQLAAFSTVEQQVMTNGLLENMASLLGLSGLGEASTWVGREVRSEAPAFFDGEPIELVVRPMPQADQSVLKVYDDFGSLVDSMTVSGDENVITWAGVGESGYPLPSGEYSFVVENLVDGQSIGTTSVLSYNEVIEAQLENGRVQLILEGGRVISADSATGIRA